MDGWRNRSDLNNDRFVVPLYKNSENWRATHLRKNVLRRKSRILYNLDILVWIVGMQPDTDSDGRLLYDVVRGRHLSNYKTSFRDNHGTVINHRQHKGS